jgi:ferredoxin-NADP reductase
VLFTRPIVAIAEATPRARIVRIDVRGLAFDFQPGQAIWVGAHGQTDRKPYSIASAPEDVARDERLELLVGVDASGEAGPHLPLASGTMLDVEGPLGRFTFPSEPTARRFLFIAGGTGIAPLRSMLHHALHVPHDEIGLLYSARRPDEFAYADELLAMSRARALELKMKVTRDVERATWAGPRGRITRDDLAPLVHDGRTLCFVCGPHALVEEMPRMLRELGVPADHIHTEQWG